MTESPLTIRQISDELHNRYREEFTVGLCFGSCRMRLGSNSHSVVEGLRIYYRSYTSPTDCPDIVISAIEVESPKLPVSYTPKQPDPGKSQIKEEFAELADGRLVRKQLTGMVFAFGNGINIAAGRCIDNLNQVINFVNNRYIQWLLDRGCLLGHASGVAHLNRGLALAGFSGSGKSTLALHLMNHDLNFVSNDRLLICTESGRLVMHGIPKQPRINPGTALGNDSLESVIPEDDMAEIENLPEEDLWELEHKYDVLVEDVYGPNRLQLSTPMNCMVILNWNRGSYGGTRTHRIDLRDRRDLLAAFTKETGLFYQPDPAKGQPDFSENAYLELLSLCSAYEVTGAVDFESATQDCLRLLSSDNTTEL